MSDLRTQLFFFSFLNTYAYGSLDKRFHLHNQKRNFWQKVFSALIKGVGRGGERSDEAGPESRRSAAGSGGAPRPPQPEGAPRPPHCSAVRGPCEPRGPAPFTHGGHMDPTPARPVPTLPAQAREDGTGRFRPAGYNPPAKVSRKPRSR